MTETMKLLTPEICWHGREPIYSVDLQPCSGSDDVQRLASCGVDKLVRVWQIREDEEGKVVVDFLSNLRRHTAPVNAVRFSPDGKFLASASDDQLVFIWKLSDVTVPVNNIFSEDSDEDSLNKENWVIHKTLRGHLGDVVDLSWSQDGRYLVSGSVDNSAIAWDLQKDVKMAIFTEHKGFVQGVAWDPLREYIATLSTDRSCRIFKTSSRHCTANLYRMVPPHLVPTPENPKPKAVRIFHDDSLMSFFRRLAFSPDGQLLVTPAGIMETPEGTRNASFIFVRGAFRDPSVCLPSPDKAAVAVRFCPRLFELRPVPVQSSGDAPGGAEKEPSVFCLPYRMIFAVATENAVVLYDTQQTKPFAYATNIHFHTLSDLTWSLDGRMLIVSSTDGYCSVLTFDEKDLGIPYTPKQAASIAMDAIPSAETTPVGDNNKAAPPAATTTTPTTPTAPAPPQPEKMELEAGSVPQPMQTESLTPPPETFSPTAQNPAVSPNPAQPPSTSDAALAADMQTVTISPPAGASSEEGGAAGGGEEGDPSSGAKQPKRIQFTTLSFNKPK